MVRGWTNVVVALGVIPLVGALLMWLAPTALGFGETTFGAAAWRRLDYVLLGLAVLCSAMWAKRRGASRLAFVWGIAGGGMTILFFLVIALALLGVSPDSTGGCPSGKIYC